jgi:hypothetical protein
MKRHRPERRMREFSYLHEKYVNKNYLKYLRLAEKDMLQHYNIRPVEMQVMLFAYDYEFFTSTHMAESLFASAKKFRQRTLQPMMQKGLIHAVHKKYKVDTGSEADMYFTQEAKMNYKHRYGLTPKARHLVQRFYRKLEGEEAIKISRE